MNRIARLVSESDNSPRNIYVLSLILLLTSLLALAPSALATAIATGSVSVTNLTITPTSGTVVFGTPWTAQSFAQAQNSLCGCDSQFNSSLGGTAQADAMVLFAQGHALTDASGLTLSASDAVNISGAGVMAANAIGQSTLFNTAFSITGGSGSVDVTFSALLNMAQFLFTDPNGVFARNDTSFQLSIDGQTLLFMDLSNQIGSNATLSDGFSGSLSDTVTLNFDQNYTLFGTAEDDPSGYDTPEPPSGSLLLLGAALLAAQRIFVAVRA
jgi:hypothetical protein